MKLIGHFAALLVALPLGGAGGAKLVGVEYAVRLFTESWGYPRWLMYVTGSLEIIAALLVLLPFSRLVGAGLALSIMVAATGTHLLNQEFEQAFPPMAIMVFSIVAGLVGRRRDV